MGLPDIKDKILDSTEYLIVWFQFQFSFCLNV